MTDSRFTPERRAAIVAELSEHIAPMLRERLIWIAEDVLDMPDTPTPLLAVWVAEIMREGLDVIRDDLAGEAEAGEAQASLSDLAAAIEVSGPTAVRRKATNAKTFASAHRLARSQGIAIPVEINGWTREVSP